MYNSEYYDGANLWQLRPKLCAIHTYKLSNGILVGMFQGNRGTHKDLDFKIKILRVGTTERPETPPHTYWVVDLLIKAQSHANEVLDILNYYINFYNTCKPFDSIEERNLYQPSSVSYIYNTYNYIDVTNTLPIDYIALMIELFCYCEKRNTGAYMFKDLLSTLKDYMLGKVDYMHVIKASMPIKRY